MRRGFSIFLILFFGLGPFAAFLAGSDDARLPPCCRRNGAHHCALNLRYAAMMAQAASGKPTFTAPSTCPCFPGSPAAATSTMLALAASQFRLPAPLALTHSPASGRAAARLGQVRARAGRGPPAANFA